MVSRPLSVRMPGAEAYAPPHTPPAPPLRIRDLSLRRAGCQDIGPWSRVLSLGVPGHRITSFHLPGDFAALSYSSAWDERIWVAGAALEPTATLPAKGWTGPRGVTPLLKEWGDTSGQARWAEGEKRAGGAE